MDSRAYQLNIKTIAADMKKSALMVAIFSSVCLFSQKSLAKPNLLMNGSFEGEYGWELAYDGAGSSGRRNWRHLDGRWSMWLNDTDSRSSEGWRSISIPIVEGVEYTAKAWVYRLQGHAPYLYVKYYNRNGREIANRSVDVRGSLGCWNHVNLTTIAPLGVTSAKLVVYSSVQRVGKNYFDNVEFTPSDNQSLVYNSTFEMDAPGSGYPTHWSLWSRPSEPFSVAIDPTDSSNQTLKLNDNSISVSANAKTVFPVTPGAPYEASARVYLEAGSQPVHLYLKFYDENGTQVASHSHQSSNSVQTWTSVSVYAQAPTTARTAAVVPYCLLSRRCTAHFDDVKVWEAFDEIRYVAPRAQGNESGNSQANAAKYNDSTFWDSVDSSLVSNPIKVVFANGTYSLSTADDRLELKGRGHPKNRLVIEAEDVYGTVFKTTSSWNSRIQLMQIIDCTNLTARNFRFTATGSEETNAAIHVLSDANHTGENIYIEDVTVSDMPGIIYAGVNVSADYLGGGLLWNPRVTRGNWVRAGQDAGYHHIYAMGNLDGLVVSGGYFEDSSGTYIKLRSQHKDTVIINCHFYSTGTYTNRNIAFIQFAVYPDVNPGDEWFGTGYQIKNNYYEFGDPSSCANTCVPFNITHNGYNPKDDEGVTREHLALLSSNKRASMQNKSFNNIHYRQYLLEKYLFLKANDCTDGICFSGNKLVGEEYEFALWISDDLGPDQQDNLSCDISNLFVYYEEVEVTMKLPAGWSMISLPIRPGVATLSILFPDAVVVYKYQKGAGYVRIQKGENLEVDRGYWILLNNPRSYVIRGTEITEYTIPVEEGWYMIGGCSSTAQKMVTNGKIDVIYGYTQGSGYTRVLGSESLERGKGYWILFSNTYEEAKFTAYISIAK